MQCIVRPKKMRLQGAFFVFRRNIIMAWITLFLAGAAVFKEPVSALRLLFAALLLAGIVGLKATSA